jgi:hypothetical protein
VGYYIEGNNSNLVKEIMSKPELREVFMNYIYSSKEDRKKFRFIRYQDSGKLEIIDGRN